MDWHSILITVIVALVFDGTLCQDVLPETLQPYKQNRTSTCYGVNSWFQPTCPDVGTVIAVQELTVGSKVNTTTCPTKVQDLGNGNFNNYTVGVTVDISCCRQETEDCTFAYDGNFNSIPPYKHFHYCTGRMNCTTVAETVRSVTSSSGTCSGSYRDETSYMYMQYYCIDETRIGDMCGSVNETVTASAFYIQNPGYPGNLSSTVTSCTCSVQSSICEDTINVYTVHVQMASDGGTCRQSLSVNGTGTSTTWDCGSETMFNITKQTSGDNYVVVQLDNTLTSDGGYIWLGFEANRPDADLVVTCPAVPESACTSNPTTDNPDSQPSTGGGGGGGIGIGVIVGVVVGLLLLIALAILIICCCCKKKANKVKPDEKKPDEEEADNDIMRSSLRFEHSAPPANTHFHSNTPIPLPLHTAETPFIMKHSGVNNIDQDIPDTHPSPAPLLPPILSARRPVGDLSTSMNGHLLTSGSASTSETTANGVVPRGGLLTPITAREVQPSVDEKVDNEEGEKKKKKKHKKKHKRKSKKKDAEMKETQDDTADNGNEDPDKQEDAVDESNA